MNVDAFASKLFADCYTTAAHQIFIPCSAHSDLHRGLVKNLVCCQDCAYPCWKGCVVVGVPARKSQQKPTTPHHEINSPNTKRPILQAELRDSDSQCTSSVANTSTHKNACARSDVCLLGEGHVGYKQGSLAVAFAPLRQPSSVRCCSGSALCTDDRVGRYHLTHLDSTKERNSPPVLRRACRALRSPQGKTKIRAQPTACSTVLSEDTSRSVKSPAKDNREYNRTCTFS